MLLAELVETSRRVAATRARLAKVELLTECLRHLAPSEVESGVAWLAGEVHGPPLAVGPALLHDVRPAAAAAEPELAIDDVARVLAAVAAASGPGSKRARGALLAALLARATAAEQDFLARLVLGELRQGALEGVLEGAIARAAGVPADALRRAVMLEGSLPGVATVAFADGAAGLARFRLELFRPLRPMLAGTAKDVAGALAELERCAFEHKLDGARVQLHKSGADVRVFTRGLNDVTTAVPELVEQARGLGARELVLDGEALALAPDGRPLPFQTTMRRFGRRLDVAALRAELPLAAFWFDCLYVDGAECFDRTAEQRVAALAAALPERALVPRLVTGSLPEAEAFLKQALALGHEGVVAKSLSAPYQAGSRGSAWLKVKPAHTLDLVVLAAEWGSGRRQGFLSNLHLGARDPVTGGFVMLGKTFKGLTDELLAWQTERLLALEVARAGRVVHVRPELVVEVAFDELQTSPRYAGGLALRFARVKGYRPDKRAAEADTLDTLRALHAGRVRAGGAG